MKKVQICMQAALAALLAALCLSARASGQSGALVLANLPKAEQSRISAALGQGIPNYYAKTTKGGLEATNPDQKLAGCFYLEGRRSPQRENNLENDR